MTASQNPIMMNFEHNGIKVGGDRFIRIMMMMMNNFFFFFCIDDNNN